MPLTSHQKRLLTAALLPLPLIAALVLGGLVLFAILACFTVLAQWEFYTLFWPGAHNARLKATALAFGLILLASFALPGGIWPLIVLLAAFWAANLAFLFAYADRGLSAAYGDCLVAFAGLIYVPLAMHLFLRFTALECVLVLLAAIATDTAAFYAGTYWGKSSLWPRVSPRKTRLGALAGLGACLLVTLVLGLFFGDAPWWGWILLGLFLGAAAQLGDLFESALKRKLDIKDSGSILPGHGGLLDRIDSLLFVLPAYGAALVLFPSLSLNHGFGQILGRLAHF
jgi:phosphatidate cytidylyltransferase